MSFSAKSGEKYRTILNLSLATISKVLNLSLLLYYRGCWLMVFNRSHYVC